MTNENMQEKLKRLSGRSLNVKDLSGIVQSKTISEKDLIKYALSKNENLSGIDTDLLAEELIRRKDFFITINDKKITSKELRDDIIKVIENPINPIPDEYWKNEAVSVIENMNDNHISPEDLRQRGKYLTNIENRQAELQTMLAIFQTSNVPDSAKNVALIKERLALLTKTKEVVKKSTKEPEQTLLNNNNTKQEQIKAKIYTQTINYMYDGKHIPDALKVKLEINEGVDFEYSVAEKMYSEQKLATKKEIYDRIKQLRGGQQEKSVVKSKSEQYTFDSKTYQIWLQKQKLNQL